MDKVSFNIEKRLGVLSESTKGWTKELNLVSWNEREAKFDIREWSPDYERMGKGITLSKDEMIKLKDLLNHMDI